MTACGRLRQCPPQFTRRRAAIERERTRPQPAKLDDGLDRRVVAEPGPTANAPSRPIGVTHTHRKRMFKKGVPSKCARNMGSTSREKLGNFGG